MVEKPLLGGDIRVRGLLSLDDYKSHLKNVKERSHWRAECLALVVSESDIESSVVQLLCRLKHSLTCTPRCSLSGTSA